MCFFLASTDFFNTFNSRITSGLTKRSFAAFLISSGFVSSWSERISFILIIYSAPSQLNSEAAFPAAYPLLKAQ